MDTKEILRRFWFVGLIAILFIGFIVVYIVQTIQNQPVVKSPVEKDGQYLIYTINGEDYTADDLYSDLLDVYGQTKAYDVFEREVCDRAIATTDEMRDIATSNAAYLLEKYGEEELTSQMKSLGYDSADDAYDYYIYIQKSMQLREDYLREHMDDIVTPYVEENHPKTISHILIRVADVTETKNEDGTVTYTANPTDEEQAKLDEVLLALENGEDFASVATEYSDDSSAENGGSLGYFDNTNTKYVTVFADAAKKLSGNETSEVITSQYGWHIIHCDTDDVEELFDNTDFLNAIFAVDPDAYYAPLLEKAEELGISFEDQDLWAKIEADIASETEDTQDTNDTTDNTESEVE